MSNASLKEQLQAVASQLSDKVSISADKVTHRPKKPSRAPETRQERKPLQKVKPRWLDYAQYGVELLKVYFPQSFKPISEVKPLKKGIKEDLIKRLSTLSQIVTEDKACMVKSLAYYVNTAAYHKSVVANAVRVDLDGNQSGTVTAEEAKYSIDRNQAKLQNKKDVVVQNQPQVLEAVT